MFFAAARASISSISTVPPMRDPARETDLPTRACPTEGGGVVSVPWNRRCEVGRTHAGKLLLGESTEYESSLGPQELEEEALDGEVGLERGADDQVERSRPLGDGSLGVGGDDEVLGLEGEQG